MTGDARAAEREPRGGRHRRGSGGATWTPKVPRAVAAPVAAEAGHGWPDLAATGLRKFNLGTIPASVTPPRTWRRAAAFAVGTAILVLCGLSYATVTLVGHPRTGATIGALPGQPSQHLVIADLPADHGDSVTTPATTTTTTSRPAGHLPASTAPPAQPRNARADRPGGPAPAASGPAGVAAATADPVHPATPDALSATAPPRSTIGSALAPASDPDRMGDRTEQYFAEVTQDPAAACQLTAGAMRQEGPEGIEARYADAQRIEVKDITIDPSWSITRSTLVIVHKDGSSTTVRRELTFSRGADPKITADNAA